MQPIIELYLASGDLIRLRERANRQFRGMRLPGSVMYHAEGEGFAITVQQYLHSNISICLRKFECKQPTFLQTKELSPGLRLEIVLSGELPIHTDDKNVQSLAPGYYQITDQPGFHSLFPSNTECTYLSVYFNADLIGSVDYPENIEQSGPTAISTSLMDTVYHLLRNPFNAKWQPSYYRIAVSELLFRHGTKTPFVAAGQLSPRQIATVREVDAYISTNLDAKITLNDLARRVASNAFLVKRGYELVFGINLFEKLIQMRMAHARYLLDNTDKPLKEIRELVGYQTLAGFVTEFKKREGLPPHDWRKRRRKGL